MLKGLSVISGVSRAVKIVNEERMTTVGLGCRALVFFRLLIGPSVKTYSFERRLPQEN